MTDWAVQRPCLQFGTLVSYFARIAAQAVYDLHVWLIQM